MPPPSRRCWDGGHYRGSPPTSPSPADGRFAPSPTGPLHLGSLRTALVAWLAARSQRARFLLRIEDLDPQRSRVEFETSHVHDLHAIGIDWDEPPVRQSRRAALYEEALAELRTQDRLYPCFCTRAEIRDAASAPHGSLPEGAYPGTCARIGGRTASRRMEAGERFALRLRAEGARVDWHDRLLGPASAAVDDFVVVRADGVHAYQLAVTVDDGAQRVGEVVRGADLAESTPRQILLATLLGLPAPSYMHVPLVVGPSGARLAKRDGGATLAQRREPVEQTLALIAHSLGLASGRARVEHASELLDAFDPSTIPTTSVKLH